MIHFLISSLSRSVQFFFCVFHSGQFYILFFFQHFPSLSPSMFFYPSFLTVSCFLHYFVICFGRRKRCFTMLWETWVGGLSSKRNMFAPSATLTCERLSGPKTLNHIFQPTTTLNAKAATKVRYSFIKIWMKLSRITFHQKPCSSRH